MCNEFELWWIFPIVCSVLMLLGMIFFARWGKGFCCFPPGDLTDKQEKINRLEQEIEELKKNEKNR